MNTEVETQPVELTTKAKARAPRQIHLTELNLVEAHEGVDNQAAICRTCVHDTNRIHHLSVEDLSAGRKAGLSLDEMECSPDQHLGVRQVLTDGTIVDLHGNTGRTSKDVIGGEVVQIRHPEKAIIGFVDTCGWTMQRKCKGCTHFSVDLTIEVPYEVNGSTRLRHMPVGGHCTLPDRCDRVQADWKIEASCENCMYLKRVSESDFAGDHHDVATIGLDPYERKQVLDRRPERIGSAILAAEREKYANPWGRWRWFPVSLIETHTKPMHTLDQDGHSIVVDVVDTVDVKFHKTGRDATFSVSDPEYWYTVHMPTSADSIRASVEIMLPHHLQYGFRMEEGTVKFARLFPDMPLHPGLEETSHYEYRKDGSVAKHWFDRRFTPPDTADLVVDDCPYCTPRKACYYHAKGGYFNTITGQYQFDHPERASVHHTDGPGFALTIRRNADGTHKVVDAFGTDPNVSVFRSQLRWLVDQAKRRFGRRAADDVRQQYDHLVSLLEVDFSPVSVTPALGKRQPNWEAFRPVCTLYSHSTEPTLSYEGGPQDKPPSGGFNLRDLFGDRFGLDQLGDEYNNGWAHRMRMTERVRTTGPGPRLQEVLMATYKHMADRQRALGVEPAEETPVFIETKRTLLRSTGIKGGEPVEFAEGEEHVLDTKGEVEAYLEWLEEKVEVPTADESGTMLVDRRWTVHGYSLFGTRSRKGQKGAGQHLDVITFNGDGDDITGSWVCPECGWHTEELADWDNPTCPNDEFELVRSYSGGEAATLGERKGIGNAIFANSEGFQTNERLRQTVCPSWVWRNSNYRDITLDDVYRPIKPVEPPCAAVIERALKDVAWYEQLGVDNVFIGGTTRGGYYHHNNTNLRPDTAYFHWNEVSIQGDEISLVERATPYRSWIGQNIARRLFDFLAHVSAVLPEAE